MNYQERYLKHQARKKDLILKDFGIESFRIYNKEEQAVFFEILRNRHSQRNFTNEEIDLEPILEAIDLAPSSCDRKGVYIKEVKNKELLSELLVGGINWLYKGKKILLLIADIECYKSPAEKDFMPYLDAGVIAQQIYLTCEVMNYGCCFVNPNIRTENKERFNKEFGIKENELLCGAIVLGKYKLKHIK